MQSPSRNVLSRPHVRTLLAPLLLVVALLCGVLSSAPAVAEELPPNGTISGTVTDSFNDPIPDVRVDFYKSATVDGTATWGYVGSATTSAAGSYSMPLYSGDYRIGFYTDDEYASEFWNNTTDFNQAASVTVATSEVPAKDAVLVENPTVSGTLTSPGGSPIDDADVTVYRLDGTWKPFHTATTDYRGQYAIGVPPGTYRLGFADKNHRTEFYNDKSTVEAGQSVVVGADGTGDLDAELAFLPAVTGTVTGPGGTPLQGIETTIYASDGSGGWKQLNRTSTDRSGRYSVRAPEGSYKLGFADSSFVYASEFYQDKTTVAAGDSVVVTSSGAAGRDARLGPNPVISGKLTSAAGAEAKDVRVVAYAPDGKGGWTPTSYDQTVVDGTYRVSVAPGTYRLGFAQYSSRFAEEFWNDKATVAAADSIVVGASDVTGRNATLASLTAIKGTVTDQGGEPVRALVSAYQLVTDDGFSYWSAQYDTVTKADGTYSLPVAPGTYHVGFTADQLQSEFWNDKPTVETADNITVTAAADITGKSAQLAPRAVVSGTISGPSGTIQGARVDALEDIGGGYFDQVDGTETGPGGTYSLPLSAGTYKLRFSAPGLATEYFDNKATAAAASDVKVGSGNLTRNAVLAAAASIKGTVTATTGGAALAGIEVTAEDANQDTVATTVTAANGTYALPVAPGSYRVRFTDPGGARIEEYWRDAAEFGQAQVVTVGSTDVGSISPSLASNPTISGTVTGNGNAPLAGVGVTLLSRYVDSGEELWIPAARTTTAANGTYAVGADAGTYRIRFDAPSPAYQTEFWDDKTTVTAATDNVLTSAGLTRNAQLSAPAGITGTVTSASGTPLAGIEVSAYGADTSQIDSETYRAATAITSSTGTYRLPVGAGSYKIGFASPNVTYAPEFWDNSATVAAAAVIAVDRADVTGKNAQLAVGTGITGTVTGAADTTRITAYRLDTSTQRWTDVAYREVENGAYTLALPAGTYRIEFVGDYEADPVYWKNATRFGDAQTVTVGASGLTSGIDVSFVLPVTNSVAPSVVGTPALGATLTADEGTWTPAAQRYEYQWLRGATPIPGATSRTYVVTPADVSSGISVRVTGIRSGFTSVAVASPATSVVADTAGNIEAPVVLGEAFFGATLTAFDGTWGSGSGALSRQWLRDGAPTGQTGPTYLLGRADQGTRIQLRVTPAADPSRAKVSAPTQVVKADASIELSFAKKGKKVRLSIRVTSEGVRPTGKVTIRAGGKRIKTVTLKRGKATFTLPRQKKGTKTYTASYAGDARTLKITGMGKLRVK